MKQISEATLSIARTAVFIKHYEAQKMLEEAKYAEETCGGGIEQTVTYWQAEVTHYAGALEELRAVA